MRQQIMQTIFLGKEDIVKLKNEGITIQAPGGHTFQLVWDGRGPNPSGGPINGKTTKAAILETLQKFGPQSPREMAQRTNVKSETLYTALYKMSKDKDVRSLGGGKWDLASRNGNGNGHSKPEVVKNGK